MDGKDMKTMLFVLRLLRGFVEFRVFGRFPERFINLLSRRNVVSWSVVPEKDGFSGRMFLSDYKKIRPLAKSSGVRLRVVKRFGMPFFINRYKLRRGLCVGAIIAIALMSLLSMFVWDVQLDGAEGLSTVEINNALKSSGLVAGTLKRSVRTDYVERRLMLRVPEIRWVSVNLLNNIAKIQIKQKAKKPKSSIAPYPCNIKAAFDGVITKTTVYSGTLRVKKGSAVTKNQLLVSAVTENADNKLSYTHANADIFADIYIVKNIEISKNTPIYIPQKNYTEKSNISFLWLTAPFRMSKSCGGNSLDNYYQYRLNLNSVSLPLGEQVLRRHYFIRSAVGSDTDKAENILRKKLCLYEAFTHSRCGIKSKEYKILENNKSYLIKSSYTFNRNIAVKQRIHIES